MKLIDYMRNIPVTDAEMAERVGMSVRGFRKVKYGERQPSLGIAVRIEDLTNGQVRLRDLVKRDAVG